MEQDTIRTYSVTQPLVQRLFEKFPNNPAVAKLKEVTDESQYEAILDDMADSFELSFQDQLEIEEALGWRFF